MTQPTRESRALIAVKIAHTAVWAFFVGCIFAIPVTGYLGRFRWSWILTAMVIGECLTLAANRGQCPLTSVAARFTTERHQGFDIYLPVWIARWNKRLFGSAFIAGLLFVLWQEFR